MENEPLKECKLGRGSHWTAFPLPLSASPVLSLALWDPAGTSNRAGTSVLLMSQEVPTSFPLCLWDCLYPQSPGAAFSVRGLRGRAQRTSEGHWNCPGESYLSRVYQFTKGPGEKSPASSHQLVRAVSIGTGTLRDEGLRRWALR